MRPGDELFSVDGMEGRSGSLAEVTDKLQGFEYQHVPVVIKRDGAKYINELYMKSSARDIHGKREGGRRRSP